MGKMKIVVEIRKATRKRFSSEQKIQVVLEGLRGAEPISEICRKYGIASPTYYQWSKSFLEAGKNGLSLDTKRDATGNECK